MERRKGGMKRGRERGRENDVYIYAPLEAAEGSWSSKCSSLVHVEEEDITSVAASESPRA